MMLASSFSGLSLGGERQNCFFGQRLATQRLDQCKAPIPFSVEAAHKKGGGSTKNGRDSNAQRRGVKVYGGQSIKPGGIIVRQVGSTVHAGVGVGQGKDFTLYALSEGMVVFKKNKYKKQVTVVPFSEYVKPEGCATKEGSRKMRRKSAYSPRNPSTVGAAPVVGP